MTLRTKWCMFAAGASLVMFTMGCTKLQSRDELNHGVQSYKNMHYADAVNHFKKAVELDPTNQSAELYLATSYMVQWVPGSDSQENVRNYDAARKTFQEVLEKHPNNDLALASMASMAYNNATQGTPEQKKAALEEAKKWNERRIEANPKDAEAYYYLGVIAWSQAYPAIMSARVGLHMPGDQIGPIKDPKVRKQLQDQWSKVIDDGLANLHKALDIDKENEDAMSYVNLLLRRKADLEETPEAAKADLAQAEDWSNKSLDMKRIKATRPKKKTEETGQ
jgi:tetratricopeptide (TPR) repeat protein